MSDNKTVTANQKENLEQEKLASRLAQAYQQIEDLKEENKVLDQKLKRIKDNPLWKATKPLRMTMHISIHQARRLINCGGPKGIAKKLVYKKREREAKKQFGTASYPSPEEIDRQRKQEFSNKVKFSILTPLYNTPERFLREMLDSVLTQTYENWELCLADGSDQDHAYVGEICNAYEKKAGGRIRYHVLSKNQGISGNTNECLKLATGDYIGLLDHDDILHPSALYEYCSAIASKEADYLYCDEVTFKGNSINRMQTLHFKPDYALDNLRANNYICHFSVFKRNLLEGGQVFRSRFDGSQDHDMILRLTDRAKHIVHVPKVLYYWRSHAGSVASGIEAKTYAIEAAKGAVAEHLRQHGLKDFKITSTRAFETIFRIQYALMGRPLISIIIPNKDHAEDLRRCIVSILEKSTYTNYEIIIVENNSTEAKTWEYYEELLGKPFNRDEEKQESQNKKITIVTHNNDFNYSLVNQRGVNQAKGEFLLFLNNDTEIITVNWMEEMLMYAQREDVGAGGAKLYYEDMTIQHAGVILGLGAHRTAGHGHYKEGRLNMGYMGRLCYAQDYAAVTGACMLVNRRKYEEVGGLDPAFAVSLNDVDLCLKLREKQYVNVFTPFAELFHYESASRGSDLEGAAAKRYDIESEMFRQKWKRVLDKGDPYFNPNFSLDRSDFSIRLPDANQ
jgi:glycosyltransferase involved in cell wall biosynthesis